jgi:hypothetical protein
MKMAPHRHVSFQYDKEADIYTKKRLSTSLEIARRTNSSWP